MKLPRGRFLLADDPGASKTIMAGLLLQELKSASSKSRDALVVVVVLLLLLLLLSENEHRMIERLKADFWLYVAFNFASTPQLHTIQNSARLDWRSNITVSNQGF